MMKTLIFQVCAIVPWGMFALLYVPLGLVGLLVQVIGTGGIIYMARTSQWGE